MNEDTAVTKREQVVILVPAGVRLRGAADALCAVIKKGDDGLQSGESGVLRAAATADRNSPLRFASSPGGLGFDSWSCRQTPRTYSDLSTKKSGEAAEVRPIAEEC